MEELYLSEKWLRSSEAYSYQSPQMYSLKFLKSLQSKWQEGQLPDTPVVLGTTLHGAISLTGYAPNCMGRASATSAAK